MRHEKDYDEQPTYDHLYQVNQDVLSRIAALEKMINDIDLRLNALKADTDKSFDIIIQLVGYGSDERIFGKR